MTFLLMIPVASFALVCLGEPNFNQGVHAFFRSPLGQNPQPANRLGKFQRKPFILAISPRKSGAHAKIGDPRPARGKSNEKPFIMAIPPRKSGAYAKTGDLRPFGGEIRRRNRLSWRSRNQARSLWRSHPGWRNHSDQGNKKGSLWPFGAIDDNRPNFGFRCSKGSKKSKISEARLSGTDSQFDLKQRRPRSSAHSARFAAPRSSVQSGESAWLFARE